MPRTSEQITQAEANAFAQFFQVDNPQYDTENNGNRVADYIINQWKETITAHTLAVAVDKLKDQLEVRSQADVQYRKIASQNVAAATQLHDWFQNQNQLLKEGDEGFENQTNLLEELRGRDINTLTIQQAIGRAMARGRKLHFVPRPPERNPLSHAESDDGKPFLHEEKDPRFTRDGRINYARMYPEEAEASKSTKMDSWEYMCRQLVDSFGSTHSSRDQMKAIFDRGVAAQTPWRKLYSEMNALKQSYERRLLPGQRGNL